MKMEAEVVLQEKYGSNPWTRLYVKPQAQENIVVLEKSCGTTVYNWFAKIFLPQGYPDSVSEDYMPYQLWDTAQAFCSTIAGVLATQEILRGVGVGDQTATPLAATITWVVKDGIGHLGKILFAFSHGSYLDAYSKKWRLYADVLNDLAMCLEIALPYFKNYTTFVLCMSSSMKAIVGVAGGASRVAMTQHHALRGNMADVSAKDAAQETAVNLIASIVALLIVSAFGTSICIFSIMLLLHIISNYMAVRSVCLRTLNEPRFQLVIALYVKQECVYSPSEINRMEPIVTNMEHTLKDMCGFRIRLGYSLRKVSKKHLDYKKLCMIRELYEMRGYLLITNLEEQEIYIILKENANCDNILCAYFHAFLLSVITCAISNYSLEIYSAKYSHRPFVEICHMLKETDWARESRTKEVPASLCEPSQDLLKFIDKIAVAEWKKAISPGLKSSGWDIEKHLLIADEWRICRYPPAFDKLSNYTREIRSASSGSKAAKPINENMQLLNSLTEPEEEINVTNLSNLELR